MKQILLALCFIAMLKIQAQINTNNQTQADTAVYALTDINDKEYLGNILSDDGRELLMMTQTMGKIYFKKTDIKKITLLSKKEIEKREYKMKL
jgi:hypothetical protein